MRELAHKFSLSRATAALNEDQGHSDKYQNEVFYSIYHRIKLKRNRFVHVQANANVKVFWRVQ